MKLTYFPLYIILITLLTACTANSTNDAPSNETTFDTTAINALFEEGEKVSFSTIRDGNIAFAIDLFKIIQTPTNNIIYSPYSISNAFGMLYGGAKAATANQIQKTLHFPSKNNLAFHRAFEELNAYTLEHPEDAITINIANKIWLKDHFVVQNGFTEMTKHFYKTDLGHFSDEHDGSNKINTWVSKQTNGKISKIITPTDLDRTKMVLANAIYFCGNWDEEFNSTKTAPDTFFSTSQPITTDFMNGKVLVGIEEFDQVNVLTLDYKDRTTSMIIVLPNEDVSLQKIIRELSVDTYLNWCKQYSKTKINLSLPKWKFSPPALPLSDHLITLGLNNPFDKDTIAPNFDYIAKNLHVGSILHKAMIEVNEKGAEAAAATTATTKDRGIAQSFSIKVNRPFLYIIKDNNMESILFMGQVIDPTLSE